MTKKEENILKALQNALKHASEASVFKVRDNDFLSQGYRTDGGESSENCIYYLDDYKKNIRFFSNHIAEYDDGQGGELKRNRWGLIPMAALRSSAALTYNIFGDEPCCHIDENEWHLCPGDYLLKYEWQSETINGHMANLDAYLFQGNCHLFVEMKMLEPLTRLHPFKSYQQYQDSDCPDAFKNAFNDFMKESLLPQHFDAFQMIKHLLAIYNHFERMNNTEPKTVVLLNCHWEPSRSFMTRNETGRGISLATTYVEFSTTAERFESLNEKYFKKLFKEKANIDLVLAHCKHSDLIRALGKEDDRYLKRYEI